MDKISDHNNTVTYTTEGKGFPIVLIHGFCEDSHMWDEFKIDLIEENFKVITIDLPGFGHSTPSDSPSIEGYAQAALKVIDQLKIEKCILIGHSMGGYTALAIAQLRPDLMAGMGLFHSHPFADSAEKKEARKKQIDFIERHGHQLYVKQLIPKLFPKRHAMSSPFDLDKLIHRAARFPQKGITDALIAMMNRPDRSDVLKTIKCPVAFIVGHEDTVIPSELSLKQLPLPNTASVHILENIGHMGMFESRRPLQLIVRQFVNFCLAMVK